MIQLEAHCKKLNKTGRMNHCKIFLNNLGSLLLSLSIWGSNDGMGKNISKEERKRENSIVKRLLGDLDSAMDKTVAVCKTRVRVALVGNIQGQYAAAHAEAQKVALPTAQDWGSHRDNGGLWFQTY